MRRCRELYNSTGTLHDVTELEWVAGSLVGEVFLSFFFFFAFLHTFLSLCASLSLPDPRDSPFDSFRSLGRNGVHIFSCVSESIHVCVDEHRARQVSEKGFFPLTRLDRLREKKMHVVVWEQAAGRLFIHRFLNALFSSLARVPVVCCFACMLNSSAYLRWGALDLFRVFLPTCLLLPLCFCYCLLFSHLEECFFFFFFLLRKHSTFCVISSGAIFVSSNLHLSHCWRIEFSSSLLTHPLTTP